MLTNDQYDDILRKAGTSHKTVRAVWGLIVVLTILLVSVSSLAHVL